MNSEPTEKIEILPETVTATDNPYQGAGEIQHAAPPERPKERVGLSIVSIGTALPLPLTVWWVWASVNAASQTALDNGIFGAAIATIVIFLLLIFVVPLTTIFSVISGYVALRRSKKLGRWLAFGSFLVTLIGIVLLILFVQMLQRVTA